MGGTDKRLWYYSQLNFFYVPQKSSGWTNPWFEQSLSVSIRNADQYSAYQSGSTQARMTFFTPFVFFKQCQFYSIASSILFTKIRNYGMREKKDFLHTWLVQCITLYQKR